MSTMTNKSATGVTGNLGNMGNMSNTELLIRKVIITFAAAFVGIFVPALLDLLNKAASGTPTSFDKAAIIALVAAAFSAGVRAVIAFLPINIVPSDSQHTLIGKKS